MPEGETQRSTFSLLAPLFATAAFGLLLLYLFTGTIVIAGLGSLFKFGSTFFWVLIVAFTIFFLYRH